MALNGKHYDAPLSFVLLLFRESFFDSHPLLGWSVGAGLVAQLSGVVYLTYDLGWDLMEPTTYLMGLAVSVASYGIYIYSKAEYEYGRHFNQCAVVFCFGCR